MAKVRQNIILHGLSGSLGDQLVIRQDRGRTIVSVKPAPDPGRESSPAQQAHRAEFRQAAAYASDAAKETPAYAERAAGTPRSAYNVAMADWFHPPEIAEVDLSGWTGQAGEAIRIQAVDDVLVKQVTVVITDEADAVLEQGAAARAEGLWWLYTTTAAAAGNPKVLVTAQDLPGHIAQATRTK